MEKILVRAFDERRNQMFWFHFCYIPDNVCFKSREVLKTKNLDAQIKMWINQDFGFDIVTRKDVVEAKNLIKQHYAQCYPEVFLENTGDRQGWTRVWLTSKLTNMLEVKHDG